MNAPRLTSLSLAVAVCLALGSVATLHAQTKSGWTEHEDQALVKAKADKKLVLLDFTGSDWCGWCVKMDKEVFSQPEFQNYAKDHLVLVELDYPHHKLQTKQIGEQNAMLAQQYNVNAFPTLVVLDSQGKTVKTFEGYQAGGAAAFVQQLQALQP